MTAAAAIETRLIGLPPKVAAPLRDLVRTGLMSPATADTVLDAHELTGEPQHLLGFAVAALEFRLAGVPVADTIRMARDQGRRISLRWSANRWRAEHNRFARAATLKKLADENEAYDVERYERHLPAKWPGYLIKSSRRLGMEGLRQRHCVAAYHRSVKNGHCAIATVFVHSTRWTVELRWTGLEDRPLAITQIRSRRNQAPPAEVREMIHERMDIPRPPQAKQGVAGSARQPNRFMENLRRVLPVLRQHGIEHVWVSFAGGGDSGQIDDVEFSPRLTDEALTAPCHRTESAWIGGEWRRANGVEDVPLKAAIEDITYDYLEATGVDWYNNDGGQGTLSIGVEAGTVDMDLSTNLRTSQVGERTDIMSGEEIERDW